MRKTFKISLIVALLVASLPSAWGFSLLGPLPADAGGEPWQVPVIGYDLPGDLGGPHNIDEEYRRVTPFMFYAYDANFLGFFGLVGATNVDNAFAIMNGTIGTNNAVGTDKVSSYSPALTEFPFGSQSYNPTAQALFLTDLKSVTLGLLVEQMGLAEPERYTWTLHDRLPGNGSPCLLTVLYTVVMRNFDILDSPLNQVQYSPYVNDILYSYYIAEFCSGPSTLGVTVPFPVDPSASKIYSSVAGFDLQIGGFYTGLTRDDVAGLRYLMNSNNINYEATASAGGLLRFSNAIAQTTLTTLPLSLLYGQAAVTDPNTLLALYPGLTYISVQTNVVNQFTTNIAAVFTNLVAPFTNTSPSFPGWTPVQYGGFQTNTTISLGDFIAAATNPPSVLQALYPDLIITLATTNSLAVQVVTNITPTFTNLFAPFTNFVAGFPTNVNFPGWQPLQYGNFLTNSTLSLSDFISATKTNDPASLQALYPGLIITTAITNSLAVVIATNIFPFFTNQTLMPVYTNNVPSDLGLGYYFTNQPGPTIINYPLTSQLFTNVDLYQFAQQARTNDAATMIGLYPNLVILSSYSTPTNQDIPNVTTYFTNALPGAPYGSPPRLITVTNGITRVFYTLYYHTFGNVVTNHAYNSSLITFSTTYVTNYIGAPYPNVYTNTTALSYYTNILSGDILIIPTNWCGFQVTATYSPLAVMGISNSISSSAFTNVVSTNTTLYSFSQSSYFTFTNRTYNIVPGICNPKLVLGTNFSTNIANVYQYSFGNVLTNHYYTNSFVNIYTTNIFSVGGVGTNLGTNVTVSSYYTNKPSGDIFIVPSDWCGYTYRTLITNLNSFTNVFTASGVGTGGQFFNQTTINNFTNYTLEMHPEFCQPVIANFTNFSTNIVAIYQYNFGNIITNHFYTNTIVRLTTTNVYYVPGAYGGVVSNIVTVTTNFLGRPSGDIFIVPSTWCGFSFTTLLTNLQPVTNTVFAGGAVGAAGTNQLYSETSVIFLTNYTWSVRPGFCEPALVMATNYSTNLVTTYNYVFGGIITNRYNPNTQARVVTTNFMLIPFGLVGATTNLVTTNFVNIGPSGDFFIVPPNFCGLTIISNLANTVTTTTNQFAATIVVGPDLGQRYTQTTTLNSTNSTFLVQPYVCSTVPASPTLRRGIEHVQFMRVNYDSLIGQFFQPFTNYYTMTVITNSQQITENYQRVITQPDILLTARDLAITPANGIIGNGRVARGIAYDSSQVLQGLHGPGTIRGSTAFIYNKVGPIFLNGPFANTNAFDAVSEFTQSVSLLQWASFDTSTNAPILYPNGTSLANLANSIYVQMLPQTLVDGTVGVFYSQAFSATGGQPPYTWSAPNLSSLVPGMTFNAGTQTMSGTPNVAGTFNFTIRLTDSINRVVDYNYTITIH